MSIMSKMLVKTGKKVAVGAVKDFAGTTLTNAAVKSTSRLLGIDEAKVDRVVEAGIPSMIFAGAEDEGVAKRLFHSSKDKGKDRNRTREESEKHFFNIFGDKGRKMNREIAEETGATQEEVKGILATFLPTFEDVIAEEDPKDEKHLMKVFRKDADHAREHGHGWIRRTMGRIFD
ncbi:MAG: hypothetical protein P8080_09360 [Gammaproteobacteria bacterium]